MRQHTIASAVLAIAVLAIGATADAQWLKHPTPGIPRKADGQPDLTAPTPKTHDGKPDLSGIWLLDPGGYALNIVLDLEPTEILPWADALYRQRSEEFSKEHPGMRCMPEIGPFYSFGRFKIVQQPGVVAILSELGPHRQILADGRDLPKDPNPTWMGYSVGRWDGDTFVVSSAGYNDKTWLDFGGHPHTEALRVTERYRRKDFGHMHVEMTFEDPKAYKRPWTISVEAELAADTELLETVCGENEKSVQHFVITDEDRKKFRAAAAVSVTTLESYAGKYEMVDPEGKKQIFTVSVKGNQLMMQPATGGAYPLQTESETVFTVAGARVVFFKDAQGTVTHFMLSIVEGDLKGVRVRDN